MPGIGILGNGGVTEMQTMRTLPSERVCLSEEAQINIIGVATKGVGHIKNIVEGEVPVRTPWANTSLSLRR